MSYPRQKRKTNHPKLKFGFNALPVTWSHREYQTSPFVIAKCGRKWEVLRNGISVAKGNMTQMLKFVATH